MSIRARSAVGAVLVGGGLMGAVGAALYMQTALFWAALGAAIAGIAVIAWTVRDVAREIGAARERYDALLRSELPPDRRDSRVP